MEKQLRDVLREALSVRHVKYLVGLSTKKIEWKTFGAAALRDAIVEFFAPLLADSRPEPRFVIEGFGGGDYAGVYDRERRMDVSQYTERNNFTRGQLERIADELNAKYAIPQPTVREALQRLDAAIEEAVPSGIAQKVYDWYVGLGCYPLPEILRQKVAEICAAAPAEPPAEGEKRTYANGLAEGRIAGLCEAAQVMPVSPLSEEWAKMACEKVACGAWGESELLCQLNAALGSKKEEADGKDRV